MRRLWIAVAVLMFTAVGHAGKAEASVYTGDEILEHCEDERVAAESICYGYLAGIIDVSLTYEHWGKMKMDFCPPAGASLSQLRKVVIKGLNEKPEELHMVAASLVHHVFRDAFPCD